MILKLSVHGAMHNKSLHNSLFMKSIYGIEVLLSRLIYQSNLLAVLSA